MKDKEGLPTQPRTNKKCSPIDNWKDPFPPPVVEKYADIIVVRDDLLEGGSKVRFLDYLIKTTDCEEWVFGGANKIGWGPISLSYLCRKYNKKCLSNIWLNN